jgi:hypothetical protein
MGKPILVNFRYGNYYLEQPSLTFIKVIFNYVLIKLSLISQTSSKYISYKNL